MIGLSLSSIGNGGDHTRLNVKKNKPGQNSLVTDAEVVDLVRTLARRMPDAAIASVLKSLVQINRPRK
jgi:hypothetical protein